MKIKSPLMGVAFAAAAAVLAPAIFVGPWNAVNAAQAGVDVSINFNMFYDRLGGHGDWTDFNGSYVFVPGNMRPDWRPYTVGHWVFTNEYG